MGIFKFSKHRKLGTFFIVTGIIIVSGLFYLWFQKVYSKPEAVFERMLSNSLSTSSVSKHSISEGEGQRLSQITRLETSPQPIIHGLVEIDQGVGEQKSLVKRETITTAIQNFIRLVNVETTQKNSSGEPFNFSPILGVWGHTAATEGDNSLTQLYGQNVAVPYANLSAPNRRLLLEQINKDTVYEVNYGAAQKVKIGGRKAYVYEVSVKPKSFISMMKTLGKMVGVKGFEDVDVEEYKNVPAVKFNFTVDVISSDLIGVDYGNGQVESFAGSGLRSKTREPKDAISLNELTQRLQNIQQ